jgi:hypothetical protein
MEEKPKWWAEIEYKVPAARLESNSRDAQLMSYPKHCV